MAMAVPGHCTAFMSGQLGRAHKFTKASTTNGRKIRMEHFVTFKMRQDGTFHAVNEEEFVIVQPVQELVEVPQLP